MTQPLPSRLPRWRGFNLLEMFHSRSDGNWREDDFRWIADWGFDFVRLPTCYLLWTDPADAFRLDEAGLAEWNADRQRRVWLVLVIAMVVLAVLAYYLWSSHS